MFFNLIKYLYYWNNFESRLIFDKVINVKDIYFFVDHPYRRGAMSTYHVRSLDKNVTPHVQLRQNLKKKSEIWQQQCNTD